MKNLPLFLATAGLVASSGAFAAFPTDAAPFQVIVPNLKSGFDFTIEGILFQPTNSDLDYGSITTLGSDDMYRSVSTDVLTVDPSYDFGFRVGIGYTFEDSGNDVQLSWTHFSSSDTDSQAIRHNDNGSPGYYLNTRLGSDLYITENNLQKMYYGAYDAVDITSSADFKLDAVDLDVGQYVDIGTRLRMRMFAGLRFAQVTNDQTTTISSDGETQNFGHYDKEYLYYHDEYVEQLDSQFTGIGPRLGVNSVYHIGNCFGLVAEASAALLVGSVDSSASVTNTYSQEDKWGGPTGVVQNGDLGDTYNGEAYTYIDSSNESRVVPALDAKLGLNYSYAFENESALTLEAGYKVSYYIDAVDKYTVNGVNAKYVNTKTVNDGYALSTPTSVDRTTSSIGFHGPYVSLNWKI